MHKIINDSPIADLKDIILVIYVVSVMSRLYRS